VTDQVPEKLADYYRDPTYERRVVVFFDVLGWRNHIAEAGRNTKAIGVLRRQILQCSRTLRLREHLEFRTSTFSDNVVITQPVSDTTQALIQQMALLQLAGVFNGFLIRGGITIGDIVHDDETVFGPGLNRAYELESAVARYPRFVLDPDLKPGSFGNLGDLPVTEDGVTFLDPFRWEFFEFIRRGKYETPNDVLAVIGLPPMQRQPYEMPASHQLLKDILEKLKVKIRSPICDRDYEKISWLFDRIANQLGVPLSQSYPRRR
jgi:hypothetical protein